MGSSASTTGPRGGWRNSGRRIPPDQPQSLTAWGFRGMSTLDLSCYTIADNARAVRVAEFRNAIEHVERLVHCDRHSCVSDAEKARWIEAARRIGRELIATTCKRARREDWDRRERAIDASTDAIFKMLGMVA